MKLCVSFEVDDDARRAARARVGQPGKATRIEMGRLLQSLAYADLAVIVAEWRAENEAAGDGKD